MRLFEVSAMYILSDESTSMPSGSAGDSANLTHKQTIKFIKGLIHQGLLRISYVDGSYRHYEITPKCKVK